MIDYETLMEWKIPVARQQLSPRDCLLYALGVGLGADPLDRSQLRYVYEGAGQGMAVMPTMATVLAYPGFWMQDNRTGLDWRRVVHASQRVVLHGPLPTAGTLVGHTRITGIVDKGPQKGALVYQERVVSVEQTGMPVCTLNMTTMCRGDGGVRNMPAAADHASSAVQMEAGADAPARPPDHVCDLPILPQAALIYRLSGDFNPLHADPEVAQRAGFRQPILHGLCTFGMAGHALLQTVGWPGQLAITDIGARFSAPVYPGETLRTEVWRIDAAQVAFRCSVVERDLVVLNRGFAQLRPEAAAFDISPSSSSSSLQEHTHGA